MEYGDLSSEANLTSPEPTKPFNQGIIEYDNVSLKYDENSQFVLKNVCFKTQRCEKIGIVGRYYDTVQLSDPNFARRVDIS